MIGLLISLHYPRSASWLMHARIPAGLLVFGLSEAIFRQQYPSLNTAMSLCIWCGSLAAVSCRTQGLIKPKYRIDNHFQKSWVESRPDYDTSKEFLRTLHFENPVGNKTVTATFS